MSDGSQPDRSRPTALATGVCAALAFTALAVLVSVGQLASLDRHALRDWMPFRSRADNPSTSFLSTLVSYSGHSFRLGGVLRVPAGALLSTLIVFALAAVLWRRARQSDALLLVVVFAVANVVETMTKDAITKPPMYAPFKGKPLHLTGFDHSFPSGHAVRASILAVAFVAVWPRVWPVLALWLGVVLVTLETDGIHAPSDIVGGLLLAASLVAAGLFVRMQTTTPVPSRLRAVRGPGQPSANAVDVARPSEGQ